MAHALQLCSSALCVWNDYYSSQGSGGNLTTIKSKKGSQHFCLCFPRTAGRPVQQYCRMSWGGPATRVAQGSQCHMVVSVFMAAVSAGYTLFSLGLNEYESRKKRPAEKVAGTSCLSLTAPPYSPLLLQLKNSSLYEKVTTLTCWSGCCVFCAFVDNAPGLNTW